MRKSFILYTDVYSCIKNLSLEEKGQLLEAIYRYSLTSEVVDLESGPEMAFNFIKLSLDRDNEKWQVICKRNAINGAKGGRPKLTQTNPKKPKKPSGYSGNPKTPDSDSESDSDNKNKEIIKKEKGISSYKQKSLGEITQADLQEIAEIYQVSLGLVSFQFENLKNYCDSTGKKYKDHKAALKNFVLKAMKDRLEGRERNDTKRGIDARSVN